MDNINRITKIDTSLNDSTHRSFQEDKKTVQNRAEKASFSDIYDIRLLSAQMNKNSSEFKLESVEEVNKELKNVIKNLDGEKADNIVGAFPSSDIIELTKMMWQNRN